MSETTSEKIRDIEDSHSFTDAITPNLESETLPSANPICLLELDDVHTSANISHIKTPITDMISKHENEGNGIGISNRNSEQILKSDDSTSYFQELNHSITEESPQSATTRVESIMLPSNEIDTHAESTTNPKDLTSSLMSKTESESEFTTVENSTSGEMEFAFQLDSIEKKRRSRSKSTSSSTSKTSVRSQPKNESKRRVKSRPRSRSGSNEGSVVSSRGVSRSGSERSLSRSKSRSSSESTSRSTPESVLRSRSLSQSRSRSRSISKSKSFSRSRSRSGSASSNKSTHGSELLFKKHGSLPLDSDDDKQKKNKNVASRFPDSESDSDDKEETDKNQKNIDQSCEYNESSEPKNERSDESDEDANTEPNRQ